MRCKLILILLGIMALFCFSCSQSMTLTGDSDPVENPNMIPSSPDLLGDIYNRSELPDLTKQDKKALLSAALYEKKREPITGNVVIKCVPEKTKIYLDGAYIGTSRKYRSEQTALKVPVGAHVLVFELKGYKNELREVLTSARETQVVALTLDPRPKMKPGEKKKKKKNEWWKVLGF